MPRFYEPDLGADPNSPFVRDASGKLDGGDLAAKAAKVAVSGVYVPEGHYGALHNDSQRAMMAAQRLPQQPNIPLLTDNASREFRQLVLTCRSNPASTQVGCPVTIIGRAITCTWSNAFGVSRNEPCVAVENG